MVVEIKSTHLVKGLLVDVMTDFLSKSKWYLLTLFLTAVATIAVFSISENTSPFIYLRASLALILIMFLPGFSLLKVLLSPSARWKNISRLERIILSIGLSLILSSFVGLILNYTPLGVRLLPITFSLMALTNILATIAFVMDFQLWAKGDDPDAYQS